MLALLELNGIFDARLGHFAERGFPLPDRDCDGSCSSSGCPQGCAETKDT